jgi:hypothetical protein
VPGSNKRSHENSMSGEYQNKTKMIFFSIWGTNLPKIMHFYN